MTIEIFLSTKLYENEKFEKIYWARENKVAKTYDVLNKNNVEINKVYKL